MSFFGRLFGSDKAMTAVVDNLSAGLDKLRYTEEERAEDVKESTAQARAMFIAWMDKTQGQNIARRFLAILIAFTWLGQYLVAQALSITAIWSAQAEKVNKAAEIVSENADGMTGAMMLILGFYFAAPHLGQIVDGAMARFGK